MDSTPTRQPYFIEEEDDTQASLSDMEAGFSGNHLFFSRSHSAPHRRGSLRNLSFFSASSPRSARFYDARFEDHQPHFLEACFLCNKPLGDNRDIYMYRLDLFFPFHRPVPFSFFLLMLFVSISIGIWLFFYYEMAENFLIAFFFFQWRAALFLLLSIYVIMICRTRILDFIRKTRNPKREKD